MNEIFSRKWLVATIATWVVILMLDELAYIGWKRVNPGSLYSGVLIKHPTQQPQTDFTPTSDYPNGYRPAGAG